MASPGSVGQRLARAQLSEQRLHCRVQRLTRLIAACIVAVEQMYGQAALRSHEGRGTTAGSASYDDEIGFVVACHVIPSADISIVRGSV